MGGELEGTAPYIKAGNYPREQSSTHPSGRRTKIRLLWNTSRVATAAWDDESFLPLIAWGGKQRMSTTTGGGAELKGWGIKPAGMSPL